MKRLQAGDVFEVNSGMKIYTRVPCRFVFSNTPFSAGQVEHDIVVGEMLTPPGTRPDKAKIVRALIRLARDYSDFESVKFNKEKMEEAISLPEFKFKSDKFDTSAYIGEYVVVEAGYSGGGAESPSLRPNDIYPDGWLIKAKKLKDGKYSKSGKAISFFQSGSFTAVNESVKTIRTLEQTFA
jgi:hypothetical protein